MDMKVDSSLHQSSNASVGPGARSTWPRSRAWGCARFSASRRRAPRRTSRHARSPPSSRSTSRSCASRTPAAVEPSRDQRVRCGPSSACVGALVTGGALLIATQSFAADQVLMDVSVAVELEHGRGARIGDAGRRRRRHAGARVNDLQLGDLRFSIVPRVPDGGPHPARGQHLRAARRRGSRREPAAADRR